MELLNGSRFRWEVGMLSLSTWIIEFLLAPEFPQLFACREEGTLLICYRFVVKVVDDLVFLENLSSFNQAC